MNLNEYQQLALTTASDRNNEIYHRVLGLVGEAGEIAEKFKKLIRDQNGDLSKLDKKDIAKELGDTLWYIATLADYLDLKLGDVAELNIQKLRDRQQRQVIGGSGDNR